MLYIYHIVIQNTKIPKPKYQNIKTKKRIDALTST